MHWKPTRRERVTDTLRVGLLGLAALWCAAWASMFGLRLLSIGLLAMGCTFLVACAVMGVMTTHRR